MKKEVIKESIVVAVTVVFISLCTIISFGTESSDNKNNKIYNGYWFYIIEGGDSTDAIIYKFNENNTVDISSYYAINENNFSDNDANHQQYKFIFDTEKNFIKIADQGSTFYIDDKHKDFYSIGSFETLNPIELFNYKEISWKNIKKAIKKKSNINITIDCSNVIFDLNNCQLDYETGNENTDGNAGYIDRTAHMTQQGDYYYYIGYNNLLYKMNKNDLDSSCCIYGDVMSEFEDIYNLTVYKNYLYFSTIDTIYRLPTSYMSDFYPEPIIRTGNDNITFYIDNSKLYYLSMQNTGITSNKITLCCCDLDNTNNITELQELGTTNKSISIKMYGVDNGYAYVSIENREASYTKFIKINTENLKSVEVISENYYDFVDSRIINGKLYFLYSNLHSFLMKQVGYTSIDFKDNSINKVFTDTTGLIKLILPNGNVIISDDKTYITTLDIINDIDEYRDSNEYDGILSPTWGIDAADFGTPITDDYISDIYAFNNEDIFYYNGNSLSYMKIDGTNWKNIYNYNK